MYILNRFIFESVKQAKEYLNSNDISLDDERFIELKHLLRKNPGYTGKFTEWLFEEDLDIDYLTELYNFIKQYKLDKDINSFNSSEDLYDYLTNVKIESKVKKAINKIPSRTRRLVNQELIDLIKNNIEQIDFIKTFFKDKSGKFDNINDLIKATKLTIENARGGWTPNSIDYKKSELVYKDDFTLILNIDSYERSAKLGSSHWCISTSEHDFNNYTSGFKKQYFIYDFTKDMSDPKSMIGVTIGINGNPSSKHLKNDKPAEKEDIKPFIKYLKPYSREYIKSKIDVNSFEEVVKYGLKDEVKRLMDKGVDPSDANNGAIRLASENGYIEIVKLLLEDKRVDPSDDDNYAIRRASDNGHLEVVELLLQDKRVDPSDWDSLAIKLASMDGHLEVVKLLLQDSRVDPSDRNNYAIGIASNNGHSEVVELLLQDKRVDPSDRNNAAIRHASIGGHSEVVKLLLQDNRVKNSLTREEYLKYKSKI